MIYKVLLVRNRYTKALSLNKGLEWFKLNTPLEIVTEEITTDFNVDSIKEVSNATLKTVVWGEDIYIKFRNIIPEGKYHAVVVIPGNDINGIRPHGYAPTIPLFPGTDLIQLYKLDDGGKALNHEIFHTFFHRLQRQQVMIEDPMDTYLNDTNLDAKPSNRSISLERLAPYWDKVGKIITFNYPVIPAQTYKYFKDSEVLGLKQELIKLLDKARELAGIPFIITSGYRTLENNNEVGGVEDSSHTHGEAVDLRARNSNEHFIITKALLDVGFLRVSRKYPLHIHVDISKDKPQKVLF